jgi:hypothetical protein
MIATEHMWSDPAYRPRLRAAGLDTVGKILRQVAGRVAAWSRTTDTLFVPGDGLLPGFYIKRHFYPRWTKRLRGTFRGTFFGTHRGQAECHALRAMLTAGLPAVRPVAYGGRRVGHFLSACFLVTEEVPDAVNLTTFALAVERGDRQLAATDRLDLLHTLADQVRAMHAAGISHGNLFWRNLLVRPAPDAQPEFFFLDAQPLRPWERLRPGGTWWVRELAQLTVSAIPFTTRTERLHFMKHYLHAKRPTPALRQLIRQVEGLAEAWRRHEDRRIRMNRLFDEWNDQLAREDRGVLAGVGGDRADEDR